MKIGDKWYNSEFKVSMTLLDLEIQNIKKVKVKLEYYSGILTDYETYLDIPTYLSWIRNEGVVYDNSIIRQKKLNRICGTFPMAQI